MAARPIFGSIGPLHVNFCGGDWNQNRLTEFVAFEPGKSSERKGEWIYGTVERNANI
jgi:hypothetical protein